MDIQTLKKIREMKVLNKKTINNQNYKTYFDQTNDKYNNIIWKYTDINKIYSDNNLIKNNITNIEIDNDLINKFKNNIDNNIIIIDGNLLYYDKNKAMLINKKKYKKKQ